MQEASGFPEAIAILLACLLHMCLFHSLAGLCDSGLARKDGSTEQETKAVATPFSKSTSRSMFLGGLIVMFVSTEPKLGGSTRPPWSLRDSPWLGARNSWDIKKLFPLFHPPVSTEDSRLGHSVSQQRGVGDARKWS